MQKTKGLSVAIQAGGMSKRMGQDKASMIFDGKPLLQKIVERANTFADETIIIANHPERLSFINQPIYPDVLPGKGPLGGLYTALLNSKYWSVGSIACDMPFFNPELLLYANSLLESGFDVVIPKTSKGLEPFHAVYKRKTCLPLIWNALQAGERRAISWLAKAQVRYLKPLEIIRYDPLQLAFFNVNTPYDVSLAKSLGSL